MGNFSFKSVYEIITAGILSCLGACSPTHVHKTVMDDGNSYHSPYDDKTLAIDNSPVLMPYNRIVDPAGTAIRFGHPSQENHSLDCVLLPGEKVLAVEDRFGLALLDVDQKKLLYHLDYEGEYKGVRSTFSGIKYWHDGNTLHIFWGAVNSASKASYIMDAVWNGQKAVMQTAIKFAAKDLRRCLCPMPLPLIRRTAKIICMWF
jgi:hypothetical protein